MGFRILKYLGIDVILLEIISLMPLSSFRVITFSFLSTALLTAEISYFVSGESLLIVGICLNRSKPLKFCLRGLSFNFEIECT